MFVTPGRHGLPTYHQDLGTTDIRCGWQRMRNMPRKGRVVQEPTVVMHPKEAGLPSSSDDRQRGPGSGQRRRIYETYKVKRTLNTREQRQKTAEQRSSGMNVKKQPPRQKSSKAGAKEFNKS